MNESVQRQIPEIRARDRISLLVRSTLTSIQRRSSTSSPSGSASSDRPSGLESTFIFISYFIHLSIDFLSLTPRGCATASVGEYVPNFFHWVVGFSYQAAYGNSLA